MTRCPRCQRRLPPKGSCPVHGRASVVASAVPETPPVITVPPNWALGREIAAGGSSVVYSISDADGRPAILKWGRWRQRDIRDRFEHEAKILRALGPPLTPQCIEHGVSDGWPYLMMEEVTGETLAALMSRWGAAAALGELVGSLIRIAAVLQQLHTAGYIHRDLKPENIVIGPNDVRLLDFGFAMVEREAAAHGAPPGGTVHYLAPEQLKQGAPLDRRTDIYALGVIAYEMIAGQPPFIGERKAIEYQHQVSRPPPLREAREIPPELEDLVLECLAKQPEARPQTAEMLSDGLIAVGSLVQTLKGVGTNPKKILGARDRVILLWVERGDAVTVTRAIADAHGIVVRSRPAGLLAAFGAQFHDAPLDIALATARELVRAQCNVVVHETSALLRRSAQGKPAFYGPEIEQPTRWTPQHAHQGLLLTASAAELHGSDAIPARDFPGFFRDPRPERTADHVTLSLVPPTVSLSPARATPQPELEPQREPPLVGRHRLVQELTAIASGGGVLVGISGVQGSGKTRTLATVVERLRKARHEVISIRARRRLPGDRPDDARLLDALGGSDDLAHALEEARARGAILVIDDVHWFSARAREQLLRDDLAMSRILASREPLFEVVPDVRRRMAIELTGLSYADAAVLLKDLLQPARLFPDVLLQRLAIRAAGIPGFLVALARDIHYRGGIRRHAGSDEWYVAADEIDTLLAAPSDAWVASRALEAVPPELAALLRVAATLGPSFQVAELATVIALAERVVQAQVASLVQYNILSERKGWYEFADASLQNAIYMHSLDATDRVQCHQAALQHWVANRTPNLVGRLARIAFHAQNAGDGASAAACFKALARDARKRGDIPRALELETQALQCFAGETPPSLAAMVDLLDD